MITGKGLSYGGSLIRPEATGYGAIYYTCEVFKHQHDDIKGKTFVVSGFGNVPRRDEASLFIEKYIKMVMDDVGPENMETVFETLFTFFESAGAGERGKSQHHRQHGKTHMEKGQVRQSVQGAAVCGQPKEVEDLCHCHRHQLYF